MLALLVIYVLVSAAGIVFSHSLAELLATVSAGLVLQFLLLITLSYALRTLKWCYLTKRLGLDGNWRQTVEIYLGGFTMSLTPGRVGEVWRAWAFNRQQAIGYRRLLPLVFCERLLDLNALLLLATLGLFSDIEVYRITAVVVFVFIPPLLLLLLKPHWGRHLIKQLWRACGRRWSRRFAAALTMCRYIEQVVHPMIYLPALLLTCLAWSLEAGAIFYAIAQLDGSLSLISAMITLGLSCIAGAVTLLPAGVGGYEAMMIYLIQQGGNTIALAIIVTGIARICTIFYAVLLGLPFFIKYSR